MAKTEFQQELSSASANAVYLLKTEDDTITGIVSLQNGVDTNTYLTNLQAHIYTVGQIIGIVGENDPNALVYTSTEFIQNGDNRKVCVEKLDAQAKLNSDNIAANLVLIGTNQTAIQDIIDSVGAADGICPLDANSKIPSQYLPDVLLQYQGTWDASTNTPTLSDATGELNQWYRCNVAGTQDLGSGNLTFEVGEKAVHNGTIWQKWDTVDTLISVFGRTGEVLAQAGDYTAAQVGLGNVTNDAQLKRESGDFNTFTEKATPVIDDIVLIEDSEDTFSKKKVKLANMLGGGGEGGINYVENSNFESDAVGHTAYKNTAGEVPTTGTGGTPTIVISRSTTDPLVGDASGLVEKGALDTQGEGINVTLKDFDNADKARIQIISFEYDASDANYVDGDYRVYFLDNTNSKVIRVNGEDIKGGKGTHYARIQVPIDCDSGSILIHCATTNANAIDFKYDRVSMAPQIISYGAFVTDWEDFTVINGDPNVIYSSLTGKYRRIGDTAHIRVKGVYSSGSGAFRADVSNVGSVDIGKYPNDQTFFYSTVHYNDTSANTYYGGSAYVSSGNVFWGFSEGSDAWDTVNPVASAVGDNITWDLEVPIQGWSANTQTSEDFGGRDVFTHVVLNSNASLSAGSAVVTPFNEVITDTAGSWDSVNKRVLIKESGFYDLAANMATLGFNDYNFVNIKVYESSGVSFRTFDMGATDTGFSRVTGAASVYCQRGQYVVVECNSSSGGTYQGNITGNVNFLTVAKRSSSQQILETERVAARYTSDSGQSVPNSSNYIVVFEDIEEDTHAAYNASTGRYTFHNSGWYVVSARFTLNGAAVSGRRSFIGFAIDGSGIADVTLGLSASNGAGGYPLYAASGTTVKYFEKNQTLDFIINQDSGSSQSLNPSGANNYFSIARIK